MTRRLSILAVASIAIGVASLTACNGGHNDQASPTTKGAVPSTHTSTASSTSLPAPAPPHNATAIAAFLRGSGSSVLAFEHATTGLTDGHKPTKSACDATRSNLSKIATGPSALLQLAARVPDPLLGAELGADIRARSVLLGECGRNTPEQLRNAHNTANAVEVRLKQVGLATG